MKYLGIDFGTVWTKAAIYNTDTGKAIRVNMDDENSSNGYALYGGQYACPTAVFYDISSNSTYVGKAAVRSRNIDPESFFNFFKPYLSGLHADDYKQLVADVLSFVYNRALNMLPPGDGFDGVVLTVPSSTIEGDTRWKSMLSAAKIAGIEIPIEIIREPEAAGYYSLGKTIRNSGIKNGTKFFIYDLGGGTFDPALIEARNGVLHIIGEWNKGLGKNMGGMYFDKVIREDVLLQVPFFNEELDVINSIPRREDGRLDLRPKSKEWMAFRNAMLYRDILNQIPVEAKHHLSENNVYTKIDPNIYEYRLSRGDFNDMIEPFIDDTLTCCNELLTINDCKWDDIYKVFMVGGSSIIPLVRSKIEQKRETENAAFEVCLHRDGTDTLDFLHAIAIGAAMYSVLKPTINERIQFGRSALSEGCFVEAEFQFIKAQSYYWLGMMEYEGLGRKKSYRNAMCYFEKVEDVYGAFMLALMYFRGEGVRKNDKMANDLIDSILNKIIPSHSLFPKVNTLLRAANMDTAQEVVEEIYLADFHKTNI